MQSKAKQQAAATTPSRKSSALGDVPGRSIYGQSALPLGKIGGRAGTEIQVR